MRAMDLDPSLAFTALYEHNALHELTSTQGSVMRDALLAAYYAQEEHRSLWGFTGVWLAARAEIRPEWGGRRCLVCGGPAITSALTRREPYWIHAYREDVASPHDVVPGPETGG